MHRVFLSNRIEALLPRLKEALFPPSSFFTKRLLVVPSPLMKSWTMQQMAQDEHLKISMGMEVCYLQQVFPKVSQWVDEGIPFKKKKWSPSSSELTFLLYGHLQRIILNDATLNQKEQQAWKPIAHFLQLPSGFSSFHDSKRSQRRLLKLCEELAPLFLQYGLYGEELLSSWKKTEDLPWQALLWKEIFDGEAGRWTYPLEQAVDLRGDFDRWKGRPIENRQVHLFGFSFLSPLHHQFFTALSQKIPVSYYFLSPCQGFWSDVCSDSTWEYLASKAPNSLEGQEAYFTDRNTLLANLGELGKQMMRQLESSSSEIEECFSLPRAILTESSYSSFLHADFAFHPTSKNFSFLEAVQADVMLMCNPAQELKKNFQEDVSIQIHFAACRRREVEIVHDLILHEIRKKAESETPLLPEEIIVMAPDMMEYLPHIDMTFGCEECPLDYRVLDLSPHIHHPLLQEFSRLLKLAKSRWEVLDVMPLFECPAFQKRFELSLEDVQQLYVWVHKGGIRWGFDQNHRQRIFPDAAEEEATGTWEEGVERILLGLFLPVPSSPLQIGGDLPVGVLPTEAVEGSQAPLLSQWLHILRSLFQDLEPLASDQAMTPFAWSSYLRRLYQKYFLANFHVPAEMAAEEKLFSSLEALLKLETPFENDTFHSDLILRFLEAELAHPLIHSKDTSVQAVRFCSMLPMRAIPARMLILMGMNEGSFPRKGKKSPLNLLERSKNKNDAPSPVDEDRYLFLETLLSARDTFIITSSSLVQSPKKTEWVPSSVVVEWISYLDKGYTLNGELPSSGMILRHPFDGFSPQYFAEGSALPRPFSKRRHLQAKAHESEKTERGSLFPLATPLSPRACAEKISRENENDQEVVVDVARLYETVRQPMRAYCQRTLGLYLDKKNGLYQKMEEDFVMPSFENYRLKKEAVKTSLSHAWQSANLKGKLPMGIFKNILHLQLQSHCKKNQETFEHFGIHPQDIFSLECRSDCLYPHQPEEGRWEIPALTFQLEDGRKIKIVGKLEDVSPRGAVVMGTDHVRDVFKNWPRCLLLNIIHQKYPSVPLSPRLLFLKKGQEKDVHISHVHEAFEKFLHYHFEALKQMSWLLPEAIGEVLENNPDKFWKLISQKMESRGYGELDPYVLWGFEREFSESKKEEIFSTSREQVEKFFKNYMP